MKAEGYEGALDEFNEARNDLASGDFKGAIHNACKSFESCLKTILGQQSGSASTLIRGLFDTGFYSDLPEDVGRAFGEEVLMALPFIRNRLGGHGQGQEKREFSRTYAELAVHLAGSLIHFSISRALEVTQNKAEKQ
jgi:HEPN domain-containing protein